MNKKASLKCVHSSTRIYIYCHHNNLIQYGMLTKNTKFSATSVAFFNGTQKLSIDIKCQWIILKAQNEKIKYKSDELCPKNVLGILANMTRSYKHRVHNFQSVKKHTLRGKPIHHLRPRLWVLNFFSFYSVSIHKWVCHLLLTNFNKNN